MKHLATLALLLASFAGACSSTPADRSPRGPTPPGDSSTLGGIPSVSDVDSAASQRWVGAAIEREGFVTEIEDGRLWVMPTGAQRTEKCITWIGAGPARMTLRAPDADTALAYLGARPGFVTKAENGRLWVLRPGQEQGEKRITKIGAGPRGSTVMAPDRETLDAWLAVR